MSDTINEENTPKTVDIPITIYTEFKADCPSRRASMQVEQTAFHINALFWIIKIAARGHELLDLQTDSKLFTLNDFTGNVDLLCQIGEGLADSLEMQMRPLVKSAEELEKQTAVRQVAAERENAGGLKNEN